MQRRIYTKEEKKQLRNNPNVLACTDKTITYSEDFKYFVLKGYYEEGKNARDMFAETGFPESIVNSKVPQWSLKTWRRIYGTAYAETNLTSQKGKGGGRAQKALDLSTMTDKEKLAYYEAKVSYIDKENDFLAQARGLKRWPDFDQVAGKNLPS